MIKNFTIFKIADHDGDEKKPTHRLSASSGDGVFMNIGSCWTKEKNGNKYLSCSLSKPYKDKPGYSIVADSEPEPTKEQEEFLKEIGDDF